MRGTICDAVALFAMGAMIAAAAPAGATECLPDGGPAASHHLHRVHYVHYVHHSRHGALRHTGLSRHRRRSHGHGHGHAHAHPASPSVHASGGASFAVAEAGFVPVGGSSSGACPVHHHGGGGAWALLPAAFTGNESRIASRPGATSSPDDLIGAPASRVSRAPVRLASIGGGSTPSGSGGTTFGPNDLVPTPPPGSPGSPGTPSTPIPPVTPIPPIVTAVPEPGTWALMITGLGLIGLAARRRRALGAELTSAAPRAAERRS